MDQLSNTTVSRLLQPMTGSRTTLEIKIAWCATSLVVRSAVQSLKIRHSFTERASCTGSDREYPLLQPQPHNNFRTSSKVVHSRRFRNPIRTASVWEALGQRAPDNSIPQVRLVRYSQH